MTLENPVITSLLDTDLYKLTMQAGVFADFSDAQVEYTYTNRTPDKKYTSEAFEWLKNQINCKIVC